MYGVLETKKHTTGKEPVVFHLPQAQNAYLHAQVTKVS
jgi:hypothetical protein